MTARSLFYTDELTKDQLLKMIFKADIGQYAALKYALDKCMEDYDSTNLNRMFMEGAFRAIVHFVEFHKPDSMTII